MADEVLARVPLRNVSSTVVTGSDGPTLETALTAFFEAAGDNAIMIAAIRVADYEVLILYSQ